MGGLLAGGGGAKGMLAPPLKLLGGGLRPPPPLPTPMDKHFHADRALGPFRINANNAGGRGGLILANLQLRAYLKRNKMLPRGASPLLPF